MFEVVGDITNMQVIATGRGIRRLKNLRKRHGGRRGGNSRVIYRSISEWIAAPGRDPLVRGSRRRQEGTEDQALPGLTL
jgi:hypothetical protein